MRSATHEPESTSVQKATKTLPCAAGKCTPLPVRRRQRRMIAPDIPTTGCRVASSTKPASAFRRTCVPGRSDLQKLPGERRRMTSRVVVIDVLHTSPRANLSVALQTRSMLRCMWRGPNTPSRHNVTMRCTPDVAFRNMLRGERSIGSPPCRRLRAHPRVIPWRSGRQRSPAARHSWRPA